MIDILADVVLVAGGEDVDHTAAVAALSHLCKQRLDSRGPSGQRKQAQRQQDTAAAAANTQRKALQQQASSGPFRSQHAPHD